jgi:adenylate kinase family enzyme
VSNVTIQRVLVIGCGGAGKTEFSLRLAEKLKLPLVHLDRYYWNAGWIPSDDPAWEERVRSIIAGQQWILDGNYASTLALRLQRADTVIFLDYPTITCVAGIIRRLFTAHGRGRDDMAQDCEERFDVGFLRYVFTFRRYQRQKVLSCLADFKGSVTMLRSRKDAKHLLQNAIRSDA